VKSSLPRARDLSSAGVGFSLRDAREGAVQTLVLLLDASCALMMRRPKQPVESRTTITDRATPDFSVEEKFMGSSFSNKQYRLNAANGSGQILLIVARFLSNLFRT
jgi:hypothetical protein